MWTPATRRQHSRDGLRYETDLTDAEWALIEPLMPKPLARGRPREWPLREVMNAIFYVLRGGVAWRLLPTDLPPRTTVYRWFSAWRDTGLFETMNHLLVMADRERVGREASPSAAVLDSQSVKTTESGGPRGLRCWQEGQRAQTTGHGRHGWARSHPGAAACGCSGPGRRTSRAAAVAALVPVHCEGVRRYGLRRIVTCNRHLDHHRDCSQARRPDRLRGSPAPLGGRAVLCLDQPEPAALERPRGHARLRQSLLLCRLDHAADPPFGPALMNFGPDSKATEWAERAFHRLQ